jgi:hypothetical protein
MTIKLLDKKIFFDSMQGLTQELAKKMKMKIKDNIAETGFLTDYYDSMKEFSESHLKLVCDKVLKTHVSYVNKFPSVAFFLKVSSDLEKIPVEVLPMSTYKPRDYSDPTILSPVEYSDYIKGIIKEHNPSFYDKNKKSSSFIMYLDMIEQHKVFSYKQNKWIDKDNVCVGENYIYPKEKLIQMFECNKNKAIFTYKGPLDE